MDASQFITVFIVVYVLWFVGRWFVLPHLKVFPHIKPLWFWGLVYGIFKFLMTIIFGWVVIFLAIVYITWLFIKEAIPDFPIPLQSILLDLFPWGPLTASGILPFIDTLVRVFVSADSLQKRLWNCATGIFKFLTRSYLYVRDAVGFHAGVGPRPDPNAYKNNGYSAAEGGGPAGSSGPKAVRRSAKSSMFEEEELQQVKDEYLQCVEEKTVPVYRNMGTETAQAIAKNQSAIVTCKLNMMQTYSNLTSYRAQ